MPDQVMVIASDLGVDARNEQVRFGVLDHIARPTRVGAHVDSVVTRNGFIRTGDLDNCRTFGIF